MSKRSIYVLASIILAGVAVIYWPITHANFVWDDWQSFHDKPWLTQGDQWKHYIFNGFNDWTYYFRPLVVALFTLQVRLFDSAPGPMHAVSLGIHLINTALVGVLSWKYAELAAKPSKTQTWMAALCMAIYGLHPALIEPLAWIGCQFDLTATLLTLLGLLANIKLQHAAGRALALAALFFLAACAKESAIAFPLLIVVSDWIFINSAQNRAQNQTAMAALLALIRRNGLAYAGIVLAGIAYLAFRHWALGSIANGLKPFPVSPFARLQVIGYIYLHYWKIILWPIAGMSPIHPFNIQSFAVISSFSVARTFLALGIFGAGLYACIRRASPLGYIVVAGTAALFPVLQIIPGQFEQSLYHERYATTAIAVICSMLPLLRWPASFSLHTHRRAVLLLPISAIFLWLSFSVVDIRTILPKWSNDISLWRWAYAVHPDAFQSREYLLHAYIQRKDFSDAATFADVLLADPSPCFGCMLDIAQVALANNDTPRATLALERLARSPLLKSHEDLRQTYFQLSAQLLIQENKLDDAEKIMRAAVASDAKDANSQHLLTKILTLKGQAAPQ